MTWFLGRGQQALFELRVFNPNTSRYLNKSLQQGNVINENEKKSAYNEKVLQVDNGTFTPLFSSIHRNMGRECHKFYSQLSDLLSQKRNLPNFSSRKLGKIKSLFRVVEIKPSLFTWLTNSMSESIAARM